MLIHEEKQSIRRQFKSLDRRFKRSLERLFYVVITSDPTDLVSSSSNNISALTLALPTYRPIVIIMVRIIKFTEELTAK